MDVFVGYGFILGLSQAWPPRTKAQVREDQPTVMVLKIREEIDPRMARYVNLAFDEAEKIKADYIIIDMNTFGGRVDNADQIAARILGAKVPVWVFINHNAASAGAWISIACDSIYMVGGASLGAATVVNGEGKEAPDKYQSYMRSKMRATAAVNGRDPKIAEAMVDPRTEIPGVIEKGKVLTFTTEEAIQNGYCEAKVVSIAAILKRNQVKGYRLVPFQLSTTEQIIALFLNPVVSSLLLLVIIGGIYFELQTPGIGFPIVASLIAATLYFTPYYLNGLAENWELLVFILGVLLLGAEVFVLPGFGIAGVAGMILTFGALLLMMLNNQGFDFTYVPTWAFYQATLVIAFGVIGSALVIIFALPRLLSSERFKNISLQDVQTGKRATSNFYTEPMLGKTGISHTVLRPSGKVLIEGQIYDAYSQGDFIEEGQPIKVISQEGTSLRVKSVAEYPV
ncbi:MAG: nodulation protein NfeD [Microscillaceae bacterium]|nr:nodulation protein NfeD [Microscillaceae bacterium]